MSAFIHSIGTAVPRFCIPQRKVLKFMQNAHRLSAQEARKLEALYRATGIRTRYSVLSDYQNTKNFTFFANSSDLEPFPDTKTRQNIYREEALALSITSARQAMENVAPEAITHLVTVSCTGMHAPGLDIGLVTALGLPGSVKRTCINFMGCYAAVNALKVAEAFCRSDAAACVLVVCTELCTLHFQKENTGDNLLSNALFGDGSAAAVVSSQPIPGALELRHFYATLEPSGKNEMAWDIGNTGFEMKLSAHVPEIVKTGIGRLVSSLAAQVPVGDVTFYAFHPGGKKILQVLEEYLGITTEENPFSHTILRDYGNMSSPTLLFVLKEIMNTLGPADAGKQILALAFGPGLTLESMILSIQGK